MHAVYGMPPAGLVDVPADAMQVSPLLPGSTPLEDLADGALDGFVMHAPRGVVERRYAVAVALHRLRPGSPLTVLAHNKLGGARLRDELAQLGVAASTAASAHFRVCVGSRPPQLYGIGEAIAAGAPRFVSQIELWSQPGIFSWDRIDPGSAMLIEHLPQLTGRGADLGCGIGVLARAALVQATVTHLTLIDLDGRAVAAASKNVDPSRATCQWADLRTICGLPKNRDFVVMNPPFHDGGTEDQTLGRLFLQRAAEMLRPAGRCLMVANRHLPYEATMHALFSQVDQMVQAAGFKVYDLRK